MKTIIHANRPLVLTLLALTSFVIGSFAQEITIPDPGLNAAIHEALGKPAGPLTPQDMLNLTNLGAVFRNITNVQGLEAAQNLVSLDLQDNRITSVNSLTNLTRLVFLDVSENRFPQLIIPGGMTNLTTLRAEFGGLTNVTLPAGLTKLTSLRLGFNQLPSLILPADMTNLSLLSVFQNQLTNLTLPPTLTSLTNLNLDGNRLNSLNLPAGMTKLDTLIASANQLTNFTVPADMTNLKFLRLNDNQLTNLTLPPDLQQLIGLFLGGNPFTTFVLSEPLAATGMASVVDSFRNQGISVFTYPLVAQFFQPLMLAGSFKFGLTGPPGVYTVLGSTNLADWTLVGTATNSLGSINFTDVTANSSPHKFYRALQEGPPANRMLILSNTFRMGSPTTDYSRTAR